MNRRRQVAALFRKMKELVVLKESSQTALEDLEAQQEKILAEAEIVVTGRMYPDVQIRFGDVADMVTEERHRPRFYLSEEGEIAHR